MPRKALNPILKTGENPLTEADREPDWDNTDLQTHLAAPLLEMPLKYDDKYLINSYRNAETGILKTGITKLLLRQEGNSIFKPVIMRIYGDSAYLAQAGNQLEENNFTQIASDFSGEVFYYDWQENFLGANRYANGQITNSIKHTNQKSLVCTEKTVYYYVEPIILVRGTLNYTGYWTSRTESYCYVSISDDGVGDAGGGYPSDDLGVDVVAAVEALTLMTTVGLLILWYAPARCKLLQEVVQAKHKVW